MTMEVYALCPRFLASPSEWQAAIDALGFDLRLQSENIPPASTGHLPAVRKGRESGFECSVIPLSDLTETYPETDFGGPWACVYAFYFGTVPSSIGAMMALTACVKLLDGLAYYPQDGRLLTGDQAVRYARDTVPEVEDLEAQLGIREN